jgi:hypothetical protein
MTSTTSAFCRSAPDEDRDTLEGFPSDGTLESLIHRCAVIYHLAIDRRSSRFPRSTHRTWPTIQVEGGKRVAQVLLRLRGLNTIDRP